MDYEEGKKRSCGYFENADDEPHNVHGILPNFPSSLLLVVLYLLLYDCWKCNELVGLFEELSHTVRVNTKISAALTQ
ncbi:hypothetical protein RvY_19030 [Ramazzottius varieornatus]|uniref:Uncharacterized protein n=1 Tax=Ramazzottius varieornatus TaxID=947166 RepID=A0A1D1W7Y7_RAMVA|nr:hypothetical protein RvY_19030 [Ramazzottius varieornatus]